MDCTPRIPTKHVVKKIRSIIVLEFLNNQMDDHLPLALLELVVALSNMIGIIMLRLVHLIGMI